MEHSHECRYKDTDKLQYAFMEAVEDRMILIGAEEFELYGKYLNYALENDKDIVLNLDQADEEPLQIVYGGMILNDKITYLYAQEISERLAGYAFFDLEEDRVNVSGYEDIIFFPDVALSKGYIPFVALMRTIHRLKDMPCSITMFPSMGGHTVWEAMANRPFILACRDSDLIEGINKDNWKDFIDKDKMLEVYQKADLVMD